VIFLEILYHFNRQGMPQGYENESLILACGAFRLGVFRQVGLILLLRDRASNILLTLVLGTSDPGQLPTTALSSEFTCNIRIQMNPLRRHRQCRGGIRCLLRRTLQLTLFLQL